LVAPSLNEIFIKSVKNETQIQTRDGAGHL
jgi:hypothetical protein